MLNRLKQYDWRNFNYSLVIIVIILCMISAFTLKLAGGAEKGAGYMRGQLIGMILGLFIVAFLSVYFYGKPEGMGRRKVNYRVFENFLYPGRRYGKRNWP